MHLHWLTIYNSNLSLPLFSYPSNALELFNRPIGMSIVRIIWLNMIITNQYILYTTLYDKVCLWLATHLWFYPNTLVSSTNKTDHHDMKEILMKVALNTITLTPNSTWIHTAVLITLSSIKMINITHEGITPTLILTLFVWVWYLLGEWYTGYVNNGKDCFSTLLSNFYIAFWVLSQLRGCAALPITM